MSLFVNPAQFDDAGDLAAYPRDEERDAVLAAEAGADLLFAPAREEVYPPGFATTVAVRGLTEPLEGERRGVGHFDGVTTVVAKLLNMVAARRGLLRPEGRPAGAGRPPPGARTSTCRCVSRSSRPCASPTALRCRAATSGSTRTTARAPLGLSRALRAAEEAVAAGEHEPDRVRKAALAALTRARRRARVPRARQQPGPVARVGDRRGHAPRGRGQGRRRPPHRQHDPRRAQRCGKSQREWQLTCSARCSSPRSTARR